MAIHHSALFSHNLPLSLLSPPMRAHLGSPGKSFYPWNLTSSAKSCSPHVQHVHWTCALCPGTWPFTELLSSEASKVSASDTLDVLHSLTHLLLVGPLTHLLIRFKSHICAKHPGECSQDSGLYSWDPGALAPDSAASPGGHRGFHSSF